MTQYLDDFYYRGAYATRRNRNIAIKRHVIIGAVMLAVWGMVIWLVA